jgi:hypothetical protein
MLYASPPIRLAECKRVIDGLTHTGGSFPRLTLLAIMSDAQLRFVARRSSLGKTLPTASWFDAPRSDLMRWLIESARFD